MEAKTTKGEAGKMAEEERRTVVDLVPGTDGIDLLVWREARRDSARRGEEIGSLVGGIRRLLTHPRSRAARGGEKEDEEVESRVGEDCHRSRSVDRGLLEVERSRQKRSRKEESALCLNEEGTGAILLLSLGEGASVVGFEKNTILMVDESSREEAVVQKVEADRPEEGTWWRERGKERRR